MTEPGNTRGTAYGDDDAGAGSTPWALRATADPDTFRAAMGRVTGSVTVVTTRHENRPWGMTVSAFSSVCLEPPTVLVCVNQNSVTAEGIHRDSRFGVNLLSQDQVPVSQLCSRLGAVKFIEDHVVDDTDLPAEVDSPVLRDSLVTFDCEVAEVRPVGSHLVVLGQVRAILAPRSRRPLLFGQGTYQKGAHIAAMTEAVA
ncbi:flavin reductase family protein [Streptomyces kunmingensis]|uniref:Flavin reductase family protein n=1 Tax=Streptomyces kunmingensis TaxID=68225 RepID=A0ABU6C5M3_9ACTN|nr:flavin reductase family protein [Streptomyces kunmingensis]MEB3959625.1 flavin reductase family protein [Streptomyces kunmingensis]